MVYDISNWITEICRKIIDELLFITRLLMVDPLTVVLEMQPQPVKPPEGMGTGESSEGNLLRLGS